MLISIALAYRSLRWHFDIFAYRCFYTFAYDYFASGLKTPHTVLLRFRLVNFVVTALHCDLVKSNSVEYSIVLFALNLYCIEIPKS